jgi:signal transduction histidine kinase
MAATLSPDVRRLGFLGALRQVVDRDFGGSLSRIEWQVEPSAEAQLQALPPLESEVLFFAAREALRNAARYGQPKDGRPLEVVIRVTCADDLQVMIEDNGNDAESPAGTPPEASVPGSGAVSSGAASSGQGIALHSTLMAVIGGSLSLDRESGQCTRVILSLPRPA